MDYVASGARPGNPSPDALLSDIGNADRLIADHGHDLRHCRSMDAWLVWDGSRWNPDPNAATERAKMVARALHQEAEAMPPSDRQRTLLRHAVWSQNDGRLRAMLAVASSDPRISVRPEQLDADPWLLNVQNGTLDLRTGHLRPHDRADLMTKVCAVDYDPAARSELWERFLTDTLGGDEELIAFVQRAAGYSLTGSTTEEVFFLVNGPERSGKSTFVGAMKSIMGSDYARTADFETFVRRTGDGGPRNDVARLHGARLVASIEVDDGKRLAEGLMKALTGGDTVTARWLYHEAFEFRPAFKLWLICNHAPKVDDADGAMWRRIVRLPFERTVPAEHADPTLKARLEDPEISGAAILAWAVEGCRDWQRNGLRVPASVKAATTAYRDEQDPLREFFKEEIVLDPNAWTSTAELRLTAGGRWVDGSGDEAVNPGRLVNELRKGLRQRGCVPKNRKKPGTNESVRGWQGIRLRTDAEHEASRLTALTADSGKVGKENPINRGNNTGEPSTTVNLSTAVNRIEFDEVPDEWLDLDDLADDVEPRGWTH